MDFTRNEMLIVQGLLVDKARKLKRQARHYIYDDEIKKMYLDDYNEIMAIEKKLEKNLGNEV